MIAPSRLVRIAFLSSLYVVLGVTSVALARADDNPPTARAARLSFVQGGVTASQADGSGGVSNSVTSGVPGQVNLPLLMGSEVTTGADGQAEIEFEDGSVVRLTPNSTLSLDNLSVGADGVFVTNLSLLRGLAYCELRATPQYSFTLSAGSDMLSPVENMTVRIDFDRSPAIFAVLDGTAEIERQPSPDSAPAGAGYRAQVRAGESLSGDANDPDRFSLTQTIQTNSWDQWNADLDQAASSQADNSTPVRDNYAGADGYGWSDLDANGSWYDVPGEGQVWQPQVASTDPGFDPYGNGAWVWYPRTGYVWASGYTWGWTPYRCGNWSYYNGFGWGWAPGAGCGGRGWGFSAGGGPVNILRFPHGYRPIHVPVARPGPFRPVLPIRLSSVGQWHDGFESHGHGPRSINGVTVIAIAPVHSSRDVHGASVSFSSGRRFGASLRRDFPVDATTHTHVLGVLGRDPDRTNEQTQPRSGLSQDATPNQQRRDQSFHPGDGDPSGRFGGRAVPGGRPEQNAPSTQLPVERTPVERNQVPTYHSPGPAAPGAPSRSRAPSTTVAPAPSTPAVAAPSRPVDRRAGQPAPLIPPSRNAAPDRVGPPDRFGPTDRGSGQQEHAPERTAPPQPGGHPSPSAPPSSPSRPASPPPPPPPAGPPPAPQSGARPDRSSPR